MQNNRYIDFKISRTVFLLWVVWGRGKQSPPGWRGLEFEKKIHYDSISNVVQGIHTDFQLDWSVFVNFGRVRGSGFKKQKKFFFMVGCQVTYIPNFKTNFQ